MDEQRKIDKAREERDSQKACGYIADGSCETGEDFHKEDGKKRKTIKYTTGYQATFSFPSRDIYRQARAMTCVANLSATLHLAVPTPR